MTGDLYPDTPCPSCGGSHALYNRDPGRHPHGTLYRYTCPASGAAVPFRPAAFPEPVILAPADALPVVWEAD